MFDLPLLLALFAATAPIAAGECDDRRARCNV